MSSHDLISVDARGPIRAPSAARVCGLHGIAGAQQQLVTLRQLRSGLDTSISELESEHRTAQFAERGLLVARFTKATCDAFLGMASALVEAVLPEAAKGAKSINAAYQAATPLAEAVSAKAVGGSFESGKVLTSSLKGASSLIRDEGYELLAQSTVVKAEIIREAMNGDGKQIPRTAGNYLLDLHVTIAKMKGMPDRIRHGAAIAEIAKGAFEYHKGVGEAFDEMLNSEEEDNERYIQQKANLLKLAKRVSAKIAELERYVQSCKPNA
jgi:hypothetical protein